MSTIDPPIIDVPRKIQQDPELAPFFNHLLNRMYEMHHALYGSGDDEIQFFQQTFEDYIGKVQELEQKISSLQEAIDHTSELEIATLRQQVEQLQSDVDAQQFEAVTKPEDVTNFGTMATQNKSSVDIDGGAIDGVTIGVNSAVSFANTGMRLQDTGGDNYVSIKINEDNASDRTLNILLSDADRTITLSGNPTLADWFDQAVKSTSDPTFNNLSITDYIEFTTATGTGAGSERWIGADGADSTVYNVPTSKSHYFDVNNTAVLTVSGSQVRIDVSSLYIPNLKSGASAAAAGAGGGELWVDTSASNVVKQA